MSESRVITHKGLPELTDAEVEQIRETLRKAHAIGLRAASDFDTLKNLVAEHQDKPGLVKAILDVWSRTIAHGQIGISSDISGDPSRPLTQIEEQLLPRLQQPLLDNFNAVLNTRAAFHIATGGPKLPERVVDSIEGHTGK